MSVKIGSIFNINIKIHQTFILFIFGLPLLIYFVQGFQAAIDLTVTLLIIFTSVLFHEVGHALMGRKFQIETKEITLLPIGGMASMEEIPEEPKKEGLIAIAGPFVSLLLAAIAYGVSLMIHTKPFSTFFEQVAILNLLLFGFNAFIPAIPLDGGRVLRAILASRMSHLRATKLSVRISHLIAMGMAIFGFIWSIWLLIIAIFIYVGANVEEAQTTQRYLLKDITVKEIMSTPVVSVPTTMSCEGLLEFVRKEGHLRFPVVDEQGKYVGMVSLRDIRPLGQNQHGEVQVKDIMGRNIVIVDPSTPVFQAVTKMQENDVGSLLVAPADEPDKILGIVTRTDIMITIGIEAVRKSISSTSELATGHP
ncbi:MAG: CBS domain-containing protein [Candidatus Heimdallarchaeota archaeon]